MIKINIKSSVTVLVLTATTGIGGQAGAGVFDQLAAVANSALPAYGRDYLANYRSDLSKETIDSGIRQALELGSDRVAESVLTLGGYKESYDNGDIEAGQLQLSSELRKAKKLAAKLGYVEQFEQFEKQLNSATLAVAPVTRDLVKAALPTVEIVEPRTLLVSHDTAATNYLYSRIEALLLRRLQPVAEVTLLQSGASDSGAKIASLIKFDDLLGRLMVEHVVEQGMKGFFLQLELQEREIRQNPQARPTPLLRDVFGSLSG